MSDEVTEPPPSPEPAAATAAQSVLAPSGPAEHQGPLRLQRYTKADGRQLILYVRETDGP